MATIRKSGADSLVALFGTIGTTADALTSTINVVGRASQAAESYVDAWATGIELDAEAQKTVAGTHAQDKAIAWLVQQEKEIQEQLSNPEDKNRFNELKAKHFPAKP